MATVNKDFKIKSGLIVEGTTGTINGNNILTENASDQYIIDLIGGETLVTSVESTQLEVINGELNVKSGVFDPAGSADAAQAAAALDATSKADQALADANVYTDQEIANEVSDRNSAIDVAINNEVTNRNDAIATAKSEAISTASSDATTKADAALVSANSYADGLAVNYDPAGSAASAQSAAATDATTKANAAQSAAESFATNADADLYIMVSGDIDTAKNSAISTAASDATTKADAALVEAKAYTDSEVAALVDGAPALLDTLNELAAAIADNPNYATDVANLVAEKANTTYVDDQINGLGTIAQGYADTAEANAIAAAATDATTKANAAQAAAEATASADATSKANAAQAAAEATASADATTKANAAQSAAEATASADATTKANAAEAAAEAYADSLAVNYDAAGSAASAQSAAEAYTDNAINDLDTDAIEEGLGNLYFTDSRAKTSAMDLLVAADKTNITIDYNVLGTGLVITAENGVADSTTDDLVEGEGNLYFTATRVIDAIDSEIIYPQAVVIDSVAKQVASTVSVPTASIAVAHSWAKANYRSAEFLVKVAYGTHTEISKVLLTLDTSDNIAITEYGIVGTNGSASSVSAAINGNNVELQVTTTNNNSDVTVVGTLLV